MKKEIDNIQNTYIIVVDGNEKEIVYDVDDSSIFSVHITGCGRGARNAVLSEDTFKTLENAEKGIEWLDSCHWNHAFKAIKVSELKEISSIGYKYLVDDINSYNDDIGWNNEREKERIEKSEIEYKERKDKALELVKFNPIFSINEYDDEITITLLKVTIRNESQAN